MNSDDFFEHCYPIQKLGGLYNYHREPFRTRSFFVVYNFLLFAVCQVYTLGSELLKVPELYEDLWLLVDSISIILIRIEVGIKVICALATLRNLEDIMWGLQDARFRYEDCGEFRPTDYFRFWKMVYSFGVRLYLVVAFLALLSQAFVGFGNFLHQGHLIETGNRTCQDFLTFNSVFPFEVDGFARCFSAFIIQIVPMMFTAFQVIAYDMPVLGILVYIRCQFVVLGGAFRTVRQRCMAEIDLPSDCEVFLDKDYPKLEVKVNKEMKRMTLHLQHLMKLTMDFESHLTYIILFQLCCTSYIMVTCLYIMSEAPLLSVAFIGHAFLCFTALLEPAHLCFFANEITYMCMELSDAMYESDWLSASDSVKSTILINMIRLKRPLYLTAGKFSPLTLATFVQLIKGAYSFFTVLSSTQH